MVRSSALLPASRVRASGILWWVCGGFVVGRGASMDAYFWGRRDSMRAGMVGARASTVGARPRSRRDWLVTGPIEARTMPEGRVRLAASKRATRLRAVDALVKVMAWG